MKVILLETLSHLGAMGDVVNVRPGYARNYLLPQGKAVVANPRNLKHVEHHKRMVEHKLIRSRKASESVREKLEKEGVRIAKKTGENEKLFGSVTAADVESALAAQGIAVSRKYIHLDEPIKKLGQYAVPVKLEGGIAAKVSVEVIAEGA